MSRVLSNSLLVLVGTLALALPLQAQTVWRCGPDGRSYSDNPCADGQVVAVADSRSPADVAEGRAVAARDQQLAQQMVVERQARERAYRARGSGLAAVAPAPVPASAVSAKRESKPASRLRPTKKSRSGASARTSQKADRATRQIQG
jgi:hypothetical protein